MPYALCCTRQVWDQRSQSQVHVVQRFQPFKPTAAAGHGGAQEMEDVKFVNPHPLSLLDSMPSCRLECPLMDP